MTPEQYEQVRRIYLLVREQPTERRAEELQRLCGDAEEVRTEVETLLSHAAQAETFLQTPVLGSAVVERGAGSCWAEPPTGELAPSAPGSAPGEDGMAPPFPERIGQYTILDVLGEGGMGVVYRAQQEKPHRLVALKVIRPGVESREVLRRFEHETEVLGWLRHPGIAQIYEAGTADTGRGPQPFFAMELVEGRTLVDYATETRISLPDRLALMARVCDAVQHAHQKGVVHRDLKPSNILVDDSGQPKILDFGVARITRVEDQAATMHTAVGQVIGTLAYMSPEQISGDAREVDTRSDVYSLGVILYELLTGRVPLDVSRQTLAQAARVIAEQEPERLRSINRFLGGDIETIAGKALEKEKARRYQSASDLASDIRLHLSDQPITARPATTFYQLRKFTRRNKALVAAIVLGFVGVTGGLVRATLDRNRAIQAERLAEERRTEAEQQAAIARAVNEFLNEDLLGTANAEEDGPRVTLQEVIDRAAAGVGERFADQPEVEAAIQLTLGRTYTSLGEFESAEPHLERATALHAAEFGPEHSESIYARFHLGLLHTRRGRYEEAEQLLQAVVDEQERLFGEGSPRLLVYLNALGNLRRRQGRFDESEQLLLRAFQGQQQLFGERQACEYGTIVDLAQLYGAQGRYDEAAELLRQAVARRHEVFGPDHTRSLVAEASLGETYTRQGRYAEAEAVHLRTIEVASRKLGEDNLYTRTAQASLAALYSDQGRFADALPLLHQALEGRRRILGPDHPRTLITANNLANAYRRLRRLDEAEPLYRETLESRKRALGADHPNTLNTMNSLANVYARQGRHDEAEKLFRETLVARRRVLGPEHPYTLSTQTNLATLYCVAGRLADAEPLLRETLDIQQRVIGPEHPKTLTSMNNLATLYNDLGRSEEAVELHRRILEARRRVLGDRHPHTLVSLQALAEALEPLEQFQEAEALYREALAGREEVFGEKDRRTFEVQFKLADLLIRRGEFEAAEPLAHGLYVGLAEIRGAEHRDTQLAVGLLVDLYEGWPRPELAGEWRERLPPAAVEVHVERAE